jgi:hypothetical protein
LLAIAGWPATLQIMRWDMWWKITFDQDDLILAIAAAISAVGISLAFISGPNPLKMSAASRQQDPEIALHRTRSCSSFTLRMGGILSRFGLHQGAK